MVLVVLAVSKLRRRNLAINLWARGREGEVQRRGLRRVLTDLHQTPGIGVTDMEMMQRVLTMMYCPGGLRSRWTAVYRSVARALEL